MLENKDVNAAQDAYASNRLTDPLTEDTSARHLVKMLDRGIWAVTYKQDVVKAKIRARGTPLTVPVSGNSSRALQPWSRGWHSSCGQARPAGAIAAAARGS